MNIRIFWEYNMQLGTVKYEIVQGGAKLSGVGGGVIIFYGYIFCNLDSIDCIMTTFSSEFSPKHSSSSQGSDTKIPSVWGKWALWMKLVYGKYIVVFLLTSLWHKNILFCFTPSRI